MVSSEWFWEVVSAREVCGEYLKDAVVKHDPNTLLTMDRSHKLFSLRYELGIVLGTQYETLLAPFTSICHSLPPLPTKDAGRTRYRVSHHLKRDRQPGNERSRNLHQVLVAFNICEIYLFYRPDGCTRFQATRKMP